MGIVDVWAAGCAQADITNEDVASGEPPTTVCQCDIVAALETCHLCDHYNRSCLCANLTVSEKLRQRLCPLCFPVQSARVAKSKSAMYLSLRKSHRSECKALNFS